MQSKQLKMILATVGGLAATGFRPLPARAEHRVLYDYDGGDTIIIVNNTRPACRDVVDVADEIVFVPGYEVPVVHPRPAYRTTYVRSRFLYPPIRRLHHRRYYGVGYHHRPHVILGFAHRHHHDRHHFRHGFRRLRRLHHGFHRFRPIHHGFLRFGHGFGRFGHGHRHHRRGFGLALTFGN